MSASAKKLTTRGHESARAAALPAPQLVGVVGPLSAADDQAMANIEKNKTVVHDFIEALFTKGDLGAVDEYLTEDYVDHDPPLGGPATREGMRRAGALCRQGCPDWHSDMHMLVGEDDIVVELFTASGTHTGEFLGVAPTGKTLTLPGINIFRLRDGRIVERWGRVDEARVKQDLGLVPTLAS